MIFTLINSRSPLENHTRFQTKTGKVIPVVKPKRPKTLPFGFGAAHTYMGYVGEYRPPPPHRANRTMISTLSPCYTGNLK